MAVSINHLKKCVLYIVYEIILYLKSEKNVQDKIQDK